MGGRALTDAGYYTLNSSPGAKENDWLGKFTGKDNVYSQEEWMKRLRRKRMGIL